MVSCDGFMVILQLSSICLWVSGALYQYSGCGLFRPWYWYWGIFLQVARLLCKAGSFGKPRKYTTPSAPSAKYEYQRQLITLNVLERKIERLNEIIQQSLHRFFGQNNKRVSRKWLVGERSRESGELMKFMPLFMHFAQLMYRYTSLKPFHLTSLHHLNPQLCMKTRWLVKKSLLREPKSHLSPHPPSICVRRVWTWFWLVIGYRERWAEVWGWYTYFAIDQCQLQMCLQ